MDWLDKLLTPGVLGAIAVIVCAVASAMIVFAVIFRERISGVSVSRTGLQMHTNDMPVWNKVVDKIEHIDTHAHKSIRKATTGLMIIDPEKYGMSTESMLVIREANFPLVCAAYENHHTREIFADGGAVYLADKTHDVSEAVRIWKKQFPELTEEKCEIHARVWTKRIVIPHVRKACLEKVDYYKSQMERTGRSSTIKEILAGCRDKNLKYIVCLDKLAEQLDGQEKTSIFYKGETS